LPERADGADALAAVQNLDTSKPNVARIYDYLLGGTDHFAADRLAAEQLIALIPNVATLAKANRTFLAAAVRRAARDGIRQYLDIGAGLPTSPSVHECARAVVPDARVVYVDNDPVAVAQAQALLTGDGLIAIEGDARQPEAITADRRLGALIDLTEPVCVLLVSLLHFFPAAEADMIVGAFRQRMVPGSYLVISQGSGGDDVPSEHVQSTYRGEATLTGRTAAEIAAYFEGFDLLPPGLLPVTEWTAAEQGYPRLRPERQPEPTSLPATILGGVGRKSG
jgi:S-adenosyl methyltransferase